MVDTKEPRTDGATRQPEVKTMKEEVPEAPPLPPPASSSSRASPRAHQTQLALLRELRTEVQDLERVLENVRQGTALLKTYEGYVQHTMGDLGELMAAIQDDAGEHDGDLVRHIRNIWEQMKVSPLLTEPTLAFDAQTQLHHLNMLAAQCREITFRVGVLTIPERLNAWLERARIGYYVPFHAVFADELPVYEDRVRLLNYLAWSPKIIHGGLVDAGSGLIYRYSRGRVKQVLTLLGVAVTLVLTFALVVGAFSLSSEGSRIQPAQFIGGWAAVLLGMIVHVGVATAKRIQTQAGLPPVVAIGDLLLLVNAKFGQILLKLLTALVGFFGLIFASLTAPGSAEVTFINTFLLGYSLDSFVGLFSASIEQRAAAQMAALKQQLGVTAGA